MANSMLPGLVNHLWQTTVFVALLALLTLALTHNAARFRYWVWLAASAKFLIPFSALVSLGPLIGKLEFVPHGTATPDSSIASQVVAPVSFIFSPPVLSRTDSFMDWLSTHSGWLALAWAAGFLVMLSIWLVEWLRMREVVRDSVPSDHPFAVQVRISNGNIEPGIAGIFRPVLLLPRGLHDRLRPDQIAAVVAHEKCHLARRDNLTAVLHRFVQTVFWLHPFVWLIGSRLAEERERACDEQVLADGHERESYAEGILEICELCIHRRAFGIARAGGGNLRRRIESIIRRESPRDIGLGRRLFILAAAVVTVAAPLAVGTLAAPAPLPQAARSSASEIELRNLTIAKSAATVGPTPRILKMSAEGRLETKNLPIRNLVAAAYRVPLAQVTGQSADVDSQFDITADLPTPARDDEIWPNAIKNLLVAKFGLEVRIEKRSISGYALRVSQGGLKIAQSTLNTSSTSVSPDQMTVTGTPLSFLVSWLSNSLSVPIVDETGLSGGFSYSLRTRPSPLKIGPWTGIGPALEEQLGLTLERKAVTVEFVDILEVHSPIN